MLTPELEQLINYALEDGVLTDKERSVLMRKAQAAGADLDEFEMILDAKLHEVQKTAATVAPKSNSNKHGEVRKCPACGAMVSAFLCDAVSVDLNSTTLKPTNLQTPFLKSCKLSRWKKLVNLPNTRSLKTSSLWLFLSVTTAAAL